MNKTLGLLFLFFCLSFGANTVWPVCNNDTNGKTIIEFKQLFPSTEQLDPILAVGKRAIEAVVQSVNDKLLDKYMLEVEFLSVGDTNNTLYRQHIQDIINSNSSLGYLFGVAPTESTVVFEELDKLGMTDSFPYIGGHDTKEFLRVPFRENVINLVGSNQEEISALIAFATSRFGVSRFGVFDSTLGLEDTVTKTLEIIGQRLIAYHVLDGSGLSDEDVDVFANKSLQAIILAIRPDQAFDFIIKASERESLKDVLILTNSVGGIAGSLGAYLNFIPTLVSNVYSVSSLPPWDPNDFSDPSESINAAFNMDLATYDPNVTIDGEKEGYSPSVGTVTLAAELKWFANIINGMPCESLTRESLIDRIYQFPSVLVAEDAFFGTFRRGCSNDPSIKCCNQGVGDVHVSSFDPDTGRWNVEFTYSWEGCSSLPEDAPIPFLIGSVTGADNNVVAFAQNGLDTGTEQFPRNVRIINYRPDATNDFQKRQQQEEFSSELAVLDKVPVFIGFSDDDVRSGIPYGIPSITFLDSFIHEGNNNFNPEGPFPTNSTPIRLFADTQCFPTTEVLRPVLSCTIRNNTLAVMCLTLSTYGRRNLI